MTAPPEPPVTVARLHGLRRADALSAEALVAALRLVAVRDPASWRHWLWAVCLSLGVVLSFGSSAYYAVVNWAAMGAWGQVGLAVLTQAAATAVAVRAGTDRLLGQLAATAAGCLIGPVLLVLAAVTTTDGEWWVLFATWAVLMVPSVLAARLSAAALAWVFVLDLTVLAGFGPLFDALRYLPDALPGLVLGLFHLGGLAVWELAAPRVAWMAGRWGPRVLGVAGVGLLTATALPTLYWEGDAATLAAIPVLAVALVVAQLLYWRGARDLLLAGAPLLAAIVLVANAGVRLIIEVLDETLLVMAVTPVLVVVLLVMTVAVLAWLRAARAFGGEGT